MINFRDITRAWRARCGSHVSAEPIEVAYSSSCCNYSNRRADRTELQKRERETCSPSPLLLLLARSHRSLAHPLWLCSCGFSDSIIFNIFLIASPACLLGCSLLPTSSSLPLCVYFLAAAFCIIATSSTALNRKVWLIVVRSPEISWDIKNAIESRSGQRFAPVNLIVITVLSLSFGKKKEFHKPICHYKCQSQQQKPSRRS